MADFASDCRWIRTESLSGFADGFGLSNVVSLLLIREYHDGEETRRESLTIPNLIMQVELPKTYRGNYEVEVREDRLILSGIPFLVGREWLEATGTSYWINGVLIDSDEVRNGFEVEYVALNETSNPLCRSLIVRRKPDERRFN